MNRSTRTAARAAAGALTLAVALGAGSAVAAPHAKPTHTVASRADSAHAQRAVLVRIAVLDARLLSAASNIHKSAIDPDARHNLSDNLDTDRNTLSLLAAGIMEHPDGNIAVARELLHSLRVANYNGVVSALRQAQRVSDALAEAQTALADDPDAPVADLESGAAAIQSAVALAGSVDGFSSKRDVNAVRSRLSVAHAALDRVQAYRDAAVTG